MTTTAKPTVIDRREWTGPYGLTGVSAIVDHPAHGRLLLSEGYGGENTPAGGCVRWRHGLVVRLLGGDTFQSLADGRWNEYVSLMEAACGGHDDSRPILPWDGNAIEAMAKRCGL